MTTTTTSISTIRLFPPTYTTSSPISTPLSILDANAATFTPSAAIWYLNPPLPHEATLTHAHLLASLTETLSLFPQWCGTLSLTPYLPGAQPYRLPAGRIVLRWYHPDDPGVSFTTATYPGRLDSVIPARNGARTCWEKTNQPASIFMSKERLAAPLADAEREGEAAPGVVVQVTSFECGGWAIAVGMTHCLADAQTLLLFVRHWALQSQRLFASSTSTNTTALAQNPPLPTPKFDPSLLDSRASGPLDTHVPDETLTELALTLPIHRHDQWASRSSAPFPIRIPASFPTTPNEPIPLAVGSKHIDWAAWDISKPCRHVILHVPASAIEALGGAGQGVSKMDILTAKIWAAIVRARVACGVAGPAEKQVAYVTLGMRGKTRSDLGDGWLGSGLLHAAVENPGSSDEAAHLIRKSLTSFTTPLISAYLHLLSHDTTPQRIWHAYLGSRSLIVTSWVWAGLYSVDFGGHGDIRYAEPIMPVLDGLLQISESPPVSKTSTSTSVPDQTERDGKSAGGKWYTHGADITLMLESECMSHFIAQLEAGEIW